MTERSSPRDALLRWYDRSARDLPWRRSREPYAVWVSEIMLQQTRVETVLRYWEPFMERFPTLSSLARADEDEVLARWSGLGYYRRARLLHAGVREVVAKYGGEIPSDAASRRSLPGIGRYTAGAIGSIAFGHEEPIVDGNVARVFTRWLGLEQPVAQLEGRLWGEAETWVRGARPGDLNQALMELGATVCVPRQRRCEMCPLATTCVARREGIADRIPLARVRATKKTMSCVALLARSDDMVWMERGSDALFGGLFGVPMREGSERDAAAALMACVGLTGALSPLPLATLEHVLTHRRLSVEVYGVDRVRVGVASSLRCFAPRELESVGVSSLTRKILRIPRR